MTGFSVYSTDFNGDLIGESGDVSISGITQSSTISQNDVYFDFQDYNNVGVHSNFRVVINGLDTSLGNSCFIRITVPDDFTVDNQMVSVTGSGFLAPYTGTQVNLFPRNTNSRTFEFEACRKDWGSNPTGALTFSKIKNPSFKRQTDTFTIEIAADSNFTQMIAQQMSGLIVLESQLQGSNIENISITPANYLVYADTSYTFQFSPVSNVDSAIQSQIKIDFPDTLTFTSSSCSIISRSSHFSNSMGCYLSANQVTLSYVFSNKPDFIGGTQLEVTISEITNPGYTGDVGAFTISTWIRYQNQYYLQDEQQVYGQVETQAGLVTKVSDVIASSYVTSKENVIYTFEVTTQHNVPVNGRVRFNFPTDIDIDGYQLISNCFRLDYSQMPIRLNCYVDEASNFFDVIISSQFFGTGGLPASQSLRVQVGGIKNPREVNNQNYFVVSSYNDQVRMIDTSTAYQGIFITMRQIGKMNGVWIAPESLKCGDTTRYLIRVIPNLNLYNGDNLYITFPTDVLLPQTRSDYVGCEGDENVAVSSCFKVTDRQIKITFNNISSSYSSIEPFHVFIYNVLNPASMKPSGAFTQIKLTSRYNNDLSEYVDNQLYVTMEEEATISNYDLFQSNQSPGQEAVYTITFMADSRLPPTVAFRISTPKQIEILRAERDDCYIDTDRVVKSRCYYRDSDTLVIKKGLYHRGTADYYGQVRIVFMAKNPDSNFYAGIDVLLEIALDETFRYPIASVEGGLTASFECRYPCISCSPHDPDDCESCPEGLQSKQFLQEDVFTGKKTCKSQCDLGYTWDRAVAKACFPCDPSCATCRQGGEDEDARMCTSCAAGYPYAWIDEAKCFASRLGCPSGTFEYTKERCRACVENCQLCTSATNCLRCDPFSSTPLLQNEGCVSQCQPAKTPVYDNDFGQCLNCQYPCATCQDGNPNFCLTCADGDYQFLFGGQCLEACPEGTTRDVDSARCVGCRQGCYECDLVDNSICIRCDRGLSLFKKQCLTECPVDFKKSEDGTVCEPRTYPFDRSFVPFPFIIMLGVFYLMTIFCWILTKRRTLIMQVFIIQTAVVLQLALIFELFKAMVEGQALFITFTMLTLIANTLLGVAFSITFHLQIDDYQFNEWQESNRKAYKVIRFFFTFFSLHMFRLLYSKVFRIQAFQASATVPHDFVRPLRLYSKLHMLIILAPILILNIFGMLFTFEGWWDNQLQMTMFESVVLVALLATFLVFEMLRADPRALLHKPSDESKFFISMFDQRSEAETPRKDGSGKKKKKGKGDKYLDQGESYWDVTDKRIRHTQLANVVRQVKSLADIALNCGLDELVDELAEGYEPEAAQGAWEMYSCPDLEHGAEKVSPMEVEDPQNMSFPGINQDDVDPVVKRRNLMSFFNEMAERDAEREREIQEQIIRQQMKVDAECMHDTELVDNCFFTSKQKVEQQAQTVALEVVERAVSAMTGLSDISKYSQFNQNMPRRKGSDQAVTQQVAKVAPLEVAAADEQVSDDDQPPSQRHLLASERPGHPAASEMIVFDEQLISADEVMNVQAAVDGIETQQISDDENEYADNKALVREMKEKKQPLELQSGIDSQPEVQKAPAAERHTRITPVVNPKAKKDHVVPATEVKSEAQPTVSKLAASDDLPEESGHEDEDFMDDENQPTDGERASFGELASATLSTARRGKGGGKKILEEPKTDAKRLQKQFMEEPLAPACSSRWLLKAQRMRTIILDEEVKAQMAEPYEGMQLQENVGRSDRSTSPTHSQLESVAISEKDRENGGIEEESYVEDDALFYKNNYPYDTHESISSVHTDEHEQRTLDATRKDFTAWMRENVVLHQRNFNENEVLGRFARDSDGRIKKRSDIRRRNFRDEDGQLVNEKGYLINEVSGAIRSRYTYDDLMIGEYGTMADIGELPMPFRLERYNFNPHKIMGSFEYCERTGKPIYLKNRFGNFTDKLFRPVNHKGFLINENADIIDNDGRVCFLDSQLMRGTGTASLFTYKGEAFRITDIIGQFLKNDHSKEIILNTDPRTGKTVDMKGRLVNAAGYLIDEKGNVVNEKGKLMFNFWEIMFQEPPKLFEFTEWDMRWIQGRLDRDVTKNPRHDDEYDLDGRPINTMGYLVDRAGNVIDQNGKVVFRKEILSQAYGQDARIPQVFTSGILKPDEVQKETSRRNSEAGKITVGGSNLDFKSNNKSKMNQTGFTGANDETRAGRSDAPMDFSGGSANFSAINETNAMMAQSSIHMSNASEKGGATGDNRTKMEMKELESSRLLNINIGGKGSTSASQAPTAQATQPAAGKKKTVKKAKAAPERPPAPMRHGDKLKQNLYSGYIEGPTNVPAEEKGSKARLKRSGARPGSRPVQSAVRNRPAQTQAGFAQGGGLLSPNSEFNLHGRPDVKMQGFMSPEQQQVRSDYSQVASDEIFNNPKQKKMNKAMFMRHQEQIAYGPNQSLNHSNSALLQPMRIPKNYQH